jgi:hypothetical protein
LLQCIYKGISAFRQAHYQAAQALPGVPAATPPPHARAPLPLPIRPYKRRSTAAAMAAITAILSQLLAGSARRCARCAPALQLRLNAVMPGLPACVLQQPSQSVLHAMSPIPKDTTHLILPAREGVLGHVCALWLSMGDLRSTRILGQRVCFLSVSGGVTGVRSSVRRDQLHMCAGGAAPAHFSSEPTCSNFCLNCLKKIVC